MLNARSFFVPLMLVVLFAGCQNVDQIDLSAEDVALLVRDEGLTCETMHLILSLPEEEQSTVATLIRSFMAPEQIGFMIANREQGCEASPHGSVTASAEAITATYSVEFIEEASGSGGSSATAILGDSSTYGWMCNNGSPETPSDYIAQYHVSGSYNNRSALRVRGTNVFASCYIQSTNAARVYSDDDIRMCIGYWHIFFCGAGSPLASETYIWLQ